MQRLDLTRIQIEAIAAHLHDELAEDERAWLDLLEGETDLYEWARRILDMIEVDQGIVANLAAQMADRGARKARAEARIISNRTALQALLECAKLDKLTLPEATVSIRDVAPKAVVNNEDELPDSLCKTKRSPDMAAIKAEMEAGRAVPGVTLDNGGVSLTIRRK